MEQKYQVISECKKIINSYQKKTKEKQEETVSLLYKVLYDAVIKNKDVLYKKINYTRNAEELAGYMRNGSFAEDACDDFAAQMFAATVNSEIISDYNEFIKKISDVLIRYNYDADNFEQYAVMWSDRIIQPAMKSVEERRLQIVEIGTGAGSEVTKKLHGFLFEKTAKIAITVIWNSPKAGKIAGKVMRKYLGTGEFRAQKSYLAEYVVNNIEKYANEIATWVCDGYNDIYTVRIKMAEQLLNDYSLV